MASTADRIHEIDEEIHRTQVNKATEHHLGELKAKMAKLRKELMAPKKSGGGGGFDVRKSGNASVVLVGFPSVGKSTLLNKITNAQSEVAEYAFTTLTVIPGMMIHKGAHIQLLDVPGIIQGASRGRGRGKEVLSVARNADLLLLLLDVFQAKSQYDIIVHELEEMAIRVNQEPPDVVITKKERGGIEVKATIKLKRISPITIEKILNVYGIHNADVVVREDINDDQFIDIVVGNRRYVPALVVLNKCDVVDSKFIQEIRKQFEKCLPISADKSAGLEELKEAIYSRLKFIRLYMRRRTGETDYDEPLIMREGSTVAEVCDRIHRDIRNSFRYAMVWGKSAKFPGQKLGLDHVMQDEDVVTVVAR